MSDPRELARQRFWSKVSFSGECWLWTASAGWMGHGQFWFGGRYRQATQVMWELLHGEPFPEGMFACHHCDNPRCVRPSHIFIGTHSDNMLDASRKGRHWESGRDHCAAGHPYEDDSPVGSRGRVCRICRRERDLRRWHNNPAYRERKLEARRRRYRAAKDQT